ncbi:IS1096 element passenger TnpR family protein [Deinococcus marmoris]|uniref:Uncharacterized protein n=1 Tax=Deinococcus marmoris TaxID=249408 RepID=A0A1U7P2T2_9DEIO|nr:hypothetical protein [Deinococcus marmoris]OLV19466.1 hypothetical protein BOO71_0002671 [Deinococcus marmoris]
MPRQRDPSELLALLRSAVVAPNPPPSLIKQARKLPLEKNGVWLLLTHPLFAPGVEEAVSTVVVLLDFGSGALLYQDVMEDLDTAELTELVLETMLDPMPATPDEGGLTMTLQPAPARQPARLLASDAYVAQSLAAELSALKVKVTHDDSPETAQMLAALAQTFQATLTEQIEAMRAKPVLAGHSDDAVRAFHAAMTDFWHAEPWEVFDPFKLVRAGWTDEHGEMRQCCATLMGDADEEYGLALFARAGEWAVLAQGAGPMSALSVLGGIERVALAEAAELDPQDLATFRRLGLKPLEESEDAVWPVLQRMTLDTAPEARIGVQTVLPVTPLPVVTALLQTLADRARARPGRQVTSLTAEVDGVSVRYPSPPADDFGEQERRGAVRVTLAGESDWNHSAPEHLTLTAPASMTLRDVWSGVEKKYGRALLPFRLEFPDAEGIEEQEFGPVPATFWHSRSGSPLLIMRHLPDAGTLDGGGQMVRAEWLPDLEVSDVELEVRAEGGTSAAPANIPLSAESLSSPVQKKAAKEKVIKAAAAPQKRAQHEGMCRLCGFVGNKASMTRHLAKCENRAATVKGEHEVYRLRVTDSRRPDYWLDVEMPVTANLDDLDGFLRGIWLECCGHMSAFTIGPEDDYADFDPFSGPPKKSRQPTLEKLGLDKGDKFGYTYDFGSSTDLNVQVQARETVAGKAGEKVRLLARNIPPALTCSECGKPAVWVNSWEYDEETGRAVLYCAQHGEDQDEEALLPVVNSPRMGVCAYEGGNLDEWPPAVIG